MGSGTGEKKFASLKTFSFVQTVGNAKTFSTVETVGNAKMQKVLYSVNGRSLSGRQCRLLHIGVEINSKIQFQRIQYGVVLCFLCSPKVNVSRATVQ